jgi:outer membrane protein assembly factor BamC
VKPLPAQTPARLATLAMAASLLGGCTILDPFSGEKVDYKSNTVKARPLEVPPDLSQLSRDSRFQAQGGVISASATAAAATAQPGATAAPAVAVLASGDIRVERNGQIRWLVVPQTPEQLWPQLKAFWEQRGFVLAVDDARIGVMETNWAENRAKLPNDVIRNTLGRLVGNLYDTGERDLFRTRIERTATGSEIFVSHRGAEEVYVGERRDALTWRAKPSDPQLEAEMLSRMMVALAPKEEQARALAAVSSAAEGPPRARLLDGQPAPTVEVDDSLDRAWRRVGLALDRGGFTVEDRDRAGGLYYVRYVDPKSAGKEEPGFFAKLFSSSSSTLTPVRYRVSLKAAGGKTQVAVLTSAGTPDSGENGKNIANLLLRELR